MSDTRQLLEELGLDVQLHERFAAWMDARYRDVILSQPLRPQAMAYFDEAVGQSHGRRVQEIVDARKRGARMIGTFCIYVPEEIVVAAGAIPVALCGGTALSIPYAERVFPRDICPLIKSTLGLAFSGTCPYGPVEDLAVGETTCDAKKKTWDVLAQEADFHVLELPQKKTPQARALWLHEVWAFKERIENLTGCWIEPDALASAIRLVNRKRRLLQDLNELRGGPLPPLSGKDALVVMQMALSDEPERFCNALEALVAELRLRVSQGVSPFPPGTPRVLVAGCPCVLGNWKLHHVIETCGAAVVGDESCTGARYYRDLVAEDGGSLEAQLQAIADRYFSLDCACFTPNTERIEHVLELAKGCRADAVVQYVLQYCHTYNIESMRIADALRKAGIPSLEVVSDYSEEDTGQLGTRVEALLERIRH
jgi:benzoyl-CoA reductase/2-hydroxyglutaryl-CoA dehydratase subunit BcrC/BadD/HgdB